MNNITICHCKKVNYEAIKKAKENGADTYDKIKEVSGAGSGCGRCKGTIEKLIKE